MLSRRDTERQSTEEHCTEEHCTEEQSTEEQSAGRNSKPAFEYGLTEKQQFYLLFHQLGLPLDIVKYVWKQYTQDNLDETRKFHQEVSPYKSHPCGNDSLFKSIGGFIDPDVFLTYYCKRESYLLSIKMINHPWFFSQINCEKDELENRVNYFTHLINQPLIKVKKLQRVRILEQAIQYLQSDMYHLHIDQIIRYIWSLYTMYKNNRILYAYPIAIDKEEKLLRFE